MKQFLLMMALVLGSRAPGNFRGEARREGEKVVVKNSGTGTWVHPIIEINFRYKLKVADMKPGAEYSFTKADLKDWEGKPPSDIFKVQVIAVETDAGKIEIEP